MLNKFLNRSLLLAILCGGLFLLTLLTLLWLRVRWDDVPPAEKTQVKISLPVINWERYLELSKQPQ